MPDEISLILSDRESGSVELLNRLMTTLEAELQDADLGAESFNKLLVAIREKLNHFAAIDNFLASLIISAGQKDAYPGDPIQFISDYRLYWSDSAGNIAENFLQHCDPAGKTILTHSHSQTVISLLSQLHERQIPFRVLQTRSSPGEEGKKSHVRMQQLKLQADLIDDENVKEALGHTDLILVGCDALLSGEFLNKVGTRAILEQAKQFNVFSALVTESRKEITRPGWKKELTEQPLFEWVPLDLIDRVVTERQV
jgi:translation initiation factor 2B subunit (eIF-2B alpha/beta/delta family)